MVRFGNRLGWLGILVGILFAVMLAFLPTRDLSAAAAGPLFQPGLLATFLNPLPQSVEGVNFRESEQKLSPLSTITTTRSEQTKSGWHLVFADEFETKTLNQSLWATQYRWGRINRPEKQYYAADAFSVKGDVLHIQSEKRVSQGMPYTSGLISSHDGFHMQYGYVEMRAKIPAGRGLWPAFWMLAHDKESDAEIDIMEILGDSPSETYMTVHYGSPTTRHGNLQGTYQGADFSSAFHTFGIEWTAERIIWFVDGIERYRTTQHVPQEPMYLIANLAVGGTWPGSPDSSTIFPAQMEIDYIRAYQR